MNNKQLRRIILDELSEGSRVPYQRRRKLSLSDLLGESSEKHLLSLEDGRLVSSGAAIFEELGGGEFDVTVDGGAFDTGDSVLDEPAATGAPEAAAPPAPAAPAPTAPEAETVPAPAPPPAPAAPPEPPPAADAGVGASDPLVDALVAGAAGESDRRAAGMTGAGDVVGVDDPDTARGDPSVVDTTDIEGDLEAPVSTDVDDMSDDSVDDTMTTTRPAAGPDDEPSSEEVTQIIDFIDAAAEGGGAAAAPVAEGRTPLHRRSLINLLYR